MNSRKTEPEWEARAHEVVRMVFGTKKLDGLLRIARKNNLSDRQRIDFIAGLVEDIAASDPELGVEWNRVTSAWDVVAQNEIGPAQFLEDPYFLGLAGEVYPKVLEEFVEMNEGDYDEIVLTGAIGTAKTTLALWVTAYHLFLLSLMVNPQRTFGLDRSSEILFVFQSINAKLAKDLDYARFKALIERSPYFMENFSFNRNLESELKFPRRIIVRPVSGQETAAIGQNVFGGVIDEVNFMAVVENSKQSIDNGEYDQARSLYNSIARRRKSRFMSAGRMPGRLCLVSSRRYPGQFTDVKEEEAKSNPRIRVYARRVWEIKPWAYSGKKFPVFVGDVSRQPAILLPEEEKEYPEHLVMQIPEEHRSEFEMDMLNALRDIAGVATLAKHPFIVNTQAISRAFRDRPSILSTTKVDLTKQELKVIRKRFFRPDLPRWVHIDLSLRGGDSTGIACGTVPEFMRVNAPEDDAGVEVAPAIRYDFQLEVVPPKTGEIPYYRIRKLLYVLRDMGLNIKWISFDSYQSADMIQKLRRKGFVCGVVSMDGQPPQEYTLFRDAIYDGRVDAVAHEHAQKEIASLELDTKKDKVDHPPNGSKDVADAMCGVAFGLSTRREVWALHEVDPVEMPDNLKAVAVRNDRKVHGDEQDAA